MLGRRDQLFKPRRVHQIVAIKDGDPVAACNRDRAVSRAGGPGVTLGGEEADARIRRGELLRYCRARVARQVVGDQDLEVRYRLSRSGLNRRSKITRAIVIGDDDGHTRRRMGLSHHAAVARRRNRKPAARRTSMTS
nr:hypothetical protein [Sphingomonas glacialis]